MFKSVSQRCVWILESHFWWRVSIKFLKYVSFCCHVILQISLGPVVVARVSSRPVAIEEWMVAPGCVLFRYTPFSHRIFCSDTHINECSVLMLISESILSHNHGVLLWCWSFSD